MAFTGLLTKLGSNECNEFFSDIKSRNKFGTEDNTVLTVLRALMNEERLATFTADPEDKGIMQSLVVENEIRLPDDEKLTAWSVHEDQARSVFPFHPQQESSRLHQAGENVRRGLQEGGLGSS